MPTQASAAAKIASRIATRNVINIALQLDAEPVFAPIAAAPQAALCALRANCLLRRNRATQRLTTPGRSLTKRVMLQRNASQPVTGRRAHIAHAALITLHAFCCGMPALAMLAAAVSGSTAGIALLADSFEQIHDFLHGRELWILGVSAALVAIGGGLELNARRSGHAHGFPWLFAFSGLCFLANVAIILAHRG